jgi:hypothetical protein
MITIPYYEYLVEFVDYDDVQKSMYLYGQNVNQIKTMMDNYKILVIDNIEVPEPCYCQTATDDLTLLTEGLQ